MLAVAGLMNVARTAVLSLRRRTGRRLRSAPTRPMDAWPSQGWGPSH